MCVSAEKDIMSRIGGSRHGVAVDLTPPQVIAKLRLWFAEAGNTRQEHPGVSDGGGFQHARTR